MWRASLSFTHFISSGEDRKLLWSVALWKWQDGDALICLPVSKLHQHHTFRAGNLWDKWRLSQWRKTPQCHLTISDFYLQRAVMGWMPNWNQRDTWNFSTLHPVSVGGDSDISLINVLLLEISQKGKNSILVGLIQLNSPVCLQASIPLTEPHSW